MSLREIWNRVNRLAAKKQQPGVDWDDLALGDGSKWLASVKAYCAIAGLPPPDPDAPEEPCPIEEAIARVSKSPANVARPPSEG